MWVTRAAGLLFAAATAAQADGVLADADDIALRDRAQQAAAIERLARRGPAVAEPLAAGIERNAVARRRRAAPRCRR